jgi:ABC-type multidrug transport system ATPase subunit
VVLIIEMSFVSSADEPTSGLDSSTAFEVMRVVQGLARIGRNCLITIHQPSPEVFALFDRLVLLQQGRVIYSGKVATVADYFTSPGMDYPPLQPGQNPAEYVIDIAG